jgi:hypothetical protein
MVVVLPAPFGPKKPYIVPLGISKSKLLTAVIFLYFFVNPLAVIAICSVIYLLFPLLKYKYSKSMQYCKKNFLKTAKFRKLFC